MSILLEIVDLKTPNLLKSSQSEQRISLIPTDSLSNSNDTPALDANKTLQLQEITLNPTIHTSNSSEDTPALNVNKTPIISKSANLSCFLHSTISQNLNKHEREQTVSEAENLRAEMIALKSFVVDKIYKAKKRSNNKDDELLIKTFP